MADNKVALEVIVDIITKVGKLNDSKLVNAVTGKLKKLKIQDLNLSPDVTINPATNAQLQQSLSALSGIMAHSANNLEGQSRKISQSILKPYKVLPKQIRQAIHQAAREASRSNAGLIADSLPGLQKSITSSASPAGVVGDLSGEHKKLNKQVGQSTLLLRQFFRFAVGYQALFGALTAVKGLAKGVVELNQALKTVQAISRATSEEMGSISRSIGDVAKETKFGLKDITEAAKTLAQAGVKPRDFDSTLRAVATFATATNSAIDLSADLQTTMRNVFTELDDRSISNVLTKAINISKLTASDLKTIVSLSAQVAKSNGLSINQFLAAVTVQRNAGIKASTVATGTRQAILELFSPDTKLTKALVTRYAELGEQMSEGAIKSLFQSFRNADNPIVSVLNELRRIGFSGAGQSTLARSVDRRAENPIRAMIEDVEKLQHDAAQLNLGEAAAIAAKIELTGLQASYDTLKATITSFTGEISGGFVDALETGVDSFTSMVTAVSNLNTELKSVDLPGFASTAESAFTGGVLGAILGKGIKGKVGGFIAGSLAGGQIDASLQKAGVNPSLVTDAAGAGVASLTLAGIFKKLQDKIKLIDQGISKTTSSASKLLKTKGFRFIAARGPGVFGPVGVAIGLLVTSLISLSQHSVKGTKETTEKVKESLQALQKIQSDATNAITDATLNSEQFELSTDDQAAKQNTMAAEFQKIQIAADTLQQRIPAFFSDNLSDNQIREAEQILLKLGTLGPEAGSRLRQQLEKQLVEITGFTGDISSSDSQQELSRLQLLASTVKESRQAFIDGFSIMLQQIRDLQESGDLSPDSFESAFIASFDSLGKTSRDILRGLEPDAGREEIDHAITKFLNTASDVALSGVDELLEDRAKSSERVAEQIVKKLSSAGGDSGTEAILDQYLSSVDLLTNSGQDFINNVTDQINKRLAELEKEKYLNLVDINTPRPNIGGFPVPQAVDRGPQIEKEFKQLTTSLGELAKIFEVNSQQALDQQVAVLDAALSKAEAAAPDFFTEEFQSFLRKQDNSGQVAEAIANIFPGGVVDELKLVIQGDDGSRQLTTSKDLDIALKAYEDFTRSRLADAEIEKDELVRLSKEAAELQVEVAANQKIVLKDFIKEVTEEHKRAGQARVRLAAQNAKDLEDIERSITESKLRGERDATNQQIEAERDRFDQQRKLLEDRKNTPGLNSDQRQRINNQIEQLRKESEARIESLRSLSEEREQAVRTKEAYDSLNEAKSFLKDIANQPLEGTTVEKFQKQAEKARELLAKVKQEATQVDDANNRTGFLEEAQAGYLKLGELQAKVTQHIQKDTAARKKQGEYLAAQSKKNGDAAQTYLDAIENINSLTEAVKEAQKFQDALSSTEIKTNTTQARAEVNELKSSLDNLRSHMQNNPIIVPVIEQRRQAFADGGAVLRARTGRQVPGYGGGDRVKALLEPGEFVINKESSRRYGALVRAINSGEGVGEAAAATLSPIPGRVSSLSNSVFPADEGTGVTDVVKVEFNTLRSTPTLFGHREQVDSLVEALREVGTGEV